jgi:hypothetical protein
MLENSFHDIIVDPLPPKKKSTTFFSFFCDVVDVFITLLSNHSSKFEPDKELAKKRAAKQMKILTAEKIRSAMKQSNDNGVMKRVGMDLLTTIANNIHVTIRNVHIRYEDSYTQPRMPYVMGLILPEVELFPSEVSSVGCQKFDPSMAPFIFDKLGFA